MKELTTYNRAAGYLNKIFDMLNTDFFQGTLQRPIITIQSTPRAYGHFTMYDAWSVKGEGVKEINIGAGTLDRPIESVIATLTHEMVHYYNYINKITDCSRGGTYHNKLFKQAAETHGLTVSHSEKYGWSTTSPSDALIEWILENNLADIRLNRNEFTGIRVSGGNNTANGGITLPPIKTNSRRYICQKCGTIIRATKEVRIICADCMELMQEG